jgi:uroporphyrinogen decarboxylase
MEQFIKKIEPDQQGFLDCLRRRGTPGRVHYYELFLDVEVQDALCRRFDLDEGLDLADPFYGQKRAIRIQRGLGYDYVRCGLDDFNMPLRRTAVEDTAAIKREGGRRYMEEHTGPITSWQDFESYPWPDPDKASTRSLEWYEENLPPDMCVVGSGGFGHFAEHLTWLMGYESLCFALYDQRDLVKAISDRLMELFEKAILRFLAFDSVKIVIAGDDMGFRTGTLISPDDMRELVLPGHRRMAELSHRAGRLYLLHSCGNLTQIMDDLIDDVGIDGKHSFEDTIEKVTDAKASYGDRIAVLGGIDVDFLCRADEERIRERTRRTLEVCMPGGGYCLGTGNSVANYIPVDSYLAMLDEGRKFS